MSLKRFEASQTHYREGRKAVDLWTMRLRRTGALAVENPAGFPTARPFAHKLHSLNKIV